MLLAVTEAQLPGDIPHPSPLGLGLLRDLRGAVITNLRGQRRDQDRVPLQQLLHVPPVRRQASDGQVGTLRTLLRQLDDAEVEVEALTVHTPDLDDVFFALTANPSKEQTR